MSERALPGIPEEQAQVDLEDGAVVVLLDEAVYPLSAVYSASFVFIDRCFVFIDRPKDGPRPESLRVRLAEKKPSGETDPLRNLVGEFSNELLSAAWRGQITKDNRATIEAVTMQAIAGAMGPPSLDELEDFDFTEEPFDDPLGIAQSWEEKYKKPAPEGEGAEE
ncbi:MAG: hypothetical protein AAGF12_10565 [Myxococcota bacterium]